MPSDESLPVYEAIQTLIPELAESEDEMIRKELVTFFKEMRDTWHEIHWHYLQVDGILAWLEKQKEQEWSQDDERNYNFLMSLCKQWESLNGYTRRRGKANTDLKSWLKELRFKKQKEPHYTKRNALFDKCVENCDPEVMKSVSDEVDEMLEKEQKFTEWDEFDKGCLKRAIWYIENPAPSVVKDTNLVLWLKSLPGRFNLQPKQEWSDEDENMLWNVISIVGESKSIQADEMLDWLKSLRPQPKQKVNNIITPNKEFFQWIYDRLVNVHKENPNVDYMISFKRRIE